MNQNSSKTEIQKEVLPLLKDFCRKNNLTGYSSQKKAQLVDLIYLHISERVKYAGKPIAEMKKLKVKDLKAISRKIGLRVNKRKIDLINQIQAPITFPFSNPSSRKGRSSKKQSPITLQNQDANNLDEIFEQDEKQKQKEERMREMQKQRNKELKEYRKMKAIEQREDAEKKREMLKRREKWEIFKINLKHMEEDQLNVWIKENIPSIKTIEDSIEAKIKRWDERIKSLEGQEDKKYLVEEFRQIRCEELANFFSKNGTSIEDFILF